jgi:DNA repair exonuclease SbcCD nuclease subunit
VGDLGVDLACLGHIHKQQIIKRDHITAFHPGSLFYLDYGERNDKKSLTEVTLDNGKFNLKLIPIEPDPIIQLEVKPDEDISEILSKLPLTARVRIVVHYSDPLLIKKDVSKRYDNYSFRDKKIIFQFEDSKATLDQKVKMSHQGMIHLDDFLKKQDKSIADLIKKYLKETR